MRDSHAIILSVVLAFPFGCGGGTRSIQSAQAAEYERCVSNLALIARTAPDRDSGNIAIDAEEARCRDAIQAICQRAGVSCRE
jgi:hypothetical protein